MAAFFPLTILSLFFSACVTTAARERASTVTSPPQDKSGESRLAKDVQDAFQQYSEQRLSMDKAEEKSHHLEMDQLAKTVLSQSEEELAERLNQEDLKAVSKALNLEAQTEEAPSQSLVRYLADHSLSIGGGLAILATASVSTKQWHEYREKLVKITDRRNTIESIGETLKKRVWADGQASLESDGLISASVREKAKASRLEHYESIFEGKYSISYYEIMASYHRYSDLPGPAHAIDKELSRLEASISTKKIQLTKAVESQDYDISRYRQHLSDYLSDIKNKKILEDLKGEIKAGKPPRMEFIAKKYNAQFGTGASIDLESYEPKKLKDLHASVNELKGKMATAKALGIAGLLAGMSAIIWQEGAGLAEAGKQQITNEDPVFQLLQKLAEIEHRLGLTKDGP